MMGLRALELVDGAAFVRGTRNGRGTQYGQGEQYFEAIDPVHAQSIRPMCGRDWCRPVGLQAGPVPKRRTLTACSS